MLLLSAALALQVQIKVGGGDRCSAPYHRRSDSARTAGDSVGRPLSGVGVGGSFVDGMIRFDVARGLYPEKRWGMNLYVEARF